MADTTTTSTVRPYTISVPDSQIEDLKHRLSLARFPDELEAAAWDLGCPLADVQRLTAYWRDEFDWRRAERDLNDRFPHFVTDIQCDSGGFESLQIHFLHKKSSSSSSSSIPLLFVHGWPGSWIEVTKIIDELAQGGGNDGHPAFDVVAPSLPNFGFSEGTKKRGFATEQYAETCHKLMLKLGYNEYVTQGGDWGFYITRAMSLLYPAHCKATHVNMDFGDRPKYTANPLLAIEHDLKPYSRREREGLEHTKWFLEEGSGYRAQQSTKPQTLGYALTDSPVALLAWIYEKLHDWTDNYPWTDEEVCTWISIYWFSVAGPAASLRIYYEAVHRWNNQKKDAGGSDGGSNNPPAPPKITRERLGQWIPHVKIGQSHFPRDIRVLPKTWTRAGGNVVFERYHDSGGHFAAWEKPEAIIGDVREMFGRKGRAKGPAFGVVKGRDGYGS